MNNKPNIPGYFLWEFDLETFNYDRSYKIVIERVLQMGNIEEWKEIIRFYGMNKILETLKWSAQLGSQEKEFTLFFLKSDFLDVA